MISNEAIFAQMELKLQQAKMVNNEAQMREALSALRTLCDVVLDSTLTGQQPNPSNAVHQVYTTQPIVMQPIVQPNPKISTEGLEEANGTSIFDF